MIGICADGLQSLKSMGQGRSGEYTNKVVYTGISFTVFEVWQFEKLQHINYTTV